ncbi:MAG: molybdopterin molybdotransferase MoeA [Myxococcaceae bacterium]|nr:molybdopterin molybdotransferase MoeA [Myxococcaceae bacterium]
MALISLKEAKTLALASVRVQPLRRVPLHEAFGRFLAEPALASRPSPAFDNAAMDGFAVSSPDTKGASAAAPAKLKLQGELHAGAPLPDTDLRSGHAMRVFTGAPLPFGADAVVHLEDAAEVSGVIHVPAEVPPGHSVRRRGEEYLANELLVSAGRRLDAAALGILAAAGQGQVPVYLQPRVAIVTCGDELVEPGQVPAPHQVHDANGALLSGLVREAGGVVHAVVRVADRDAELRAALEQLAAEADVIVTAGGASVGGRDRLKAVAQALGGTLGFDGVAIKPGRPVGLALIRQVPVALLPGNPGAAMVAFDQLVRPMLLKAQGVFEHRHVERAALQVAQRKQPGLTVFLPAQLDRTQAGGPVVRPRKVAPGQLLGLLGIDGWLVLPSGQSDFPAGAQVELETFGQATHTPLSLGLGDEITR